MTAAAKEKERTPRGVPSRLNMQPRIPGMKYNKNGTCDLRCRAARELLGGKNADGTDDMRFKENRKKKKK